MINLLQSMLCRMPLVLCLTVTSDSHYWVDDRVATAKQDAHADEQALVLLVETIRDNDNVETRVALLKGMLAGLEGRRDLPVPAGWSKLSEELARSKDARLRNLSMELSQIFGDQSAIDHALTLIKNKNTDSATRRRMLQLLLSQQNQNASDALESLLDEPEMILDAIRGYAVLENKSAPRILLTRYSKMKPDQQRAVVETLSSRHTYALQLLNALVENVVPKSDIPPHVARTMEQQLGEQFLSFFGQVKSIAEDREKTLAKYKAMVTSEAMDNADAARGRSVFAKTCASCHLLYGEGGKVGPDLTGSNRANLDYILLNSVDPSFDVPDAYKTTVIQTIDGRIINGVLAEEDDRKIILKTAEQPRVVIAKADIDVRKLSPKSVMPDGQLDQLKKQEILDLIKYLRTTEQVEMAK